MTRRNRGLENFQRVPCGDHWIFEELWRWYHDERLGEEADGGRRGRRTLGDTVRDRCDKAG